MDQLNYAAILPKAGRDLESSGKGVVPRMGQEDDRPAGLLGEREGLALRSAGEHEEDVGGFRGDGRGVGRQDLHLAMPAKRLRQGTEQTLCFTMEPGHER
jgi:hypothetical protein